MSKKQKSLEKRITDLEIIENQRKMNDKINLLESQVKKLTSELHETRSILLSRITKGTCEIQPRSVHSLRNVNDLNST